MEKVGEGRGYQGSWNSEGKRERERENERESRQEEVIIYNELT